MWTELITYRHHMMGAAGHTFKLKALQKKNELFHAPFVVYAPFVVHACHMWLIHLKN